MRERTLGEARNRISRIYTRLHRGHHERTGDRIAYVSDDAEGCVYRTGWTEAERTNWERDSSPFLVSEGGHARPISVLDDVDVYLGRFSHISQ